MAEGDGRGNEEGGGTGGEEGDEKESNEEDNNSGRDEEEDANIRWQDVMKANYKPLKVLDWTEQHVDFVSQETSYPDRVKGHGSGWLFLHFNTQCSVEDIDELDQELLNEEPRIEGPRPIGFRDETLPLTREYLSKYRHANDRAGKDRCTTFNALWKKWLKVGGPYFARFNWTKLKPMEMFFHRLDFHPWTPATNNANCCRHRPVELINVINDVPGKAGDKPVGTVCLLPGILCFDTSARLNALNGFSIGDVVSIGESTSYEIVIGVIVYSLHGSGRNWCDWTEYAASTASLRPASSPMKLLTISMDGVPDFSNYYRKLEPGTKDDILNTRKLIDELCADDDNDRMIHLREVVSSDQELQPSFHYVWYHRAVHQEVALMASICYGTITSSTGIQKFAKMLRQRLSVTRTAARGGGGSTTGGRGGGGGGSTTGARGGGGGGSTGPGKGGGGGGSTGPGKGRSASGGGGGGSTAKKPTPGRRGEKRRREDEEGLEEVESVVSADRLALYNEDEPFMHWVDRVVQVAIGVAQKSVVNLVHNGVVRQEAEYENQLKRFRKDVTVGLQDGLKSRLKDSDAQRKALAAHIANVTSAVTSCSTYSQVESLGTQIESVAKSSQIEALGDQMDSVAKSADVERITTAVTTSLEALTSADHPLTTLVTEAVAKKLEAPFKQVNECTVNVNKVLLEALPLANQTELESLRSLVSGLVTINKAQSEEIEHLHRKVDGLVGSNVQLGHKLDSMNSSILLMSKILAGVGSGAGAGGTSSVGGGQGGTTSGDGGGIGGKTTGTVTSLSVGSTGEGTHASALGGTVGGAVAAANKSISDLTTRLEGLKK